MFGIYIHLPFCLRKCRYCSFNSSPGIEEHIPAYVEEVIEELRASAVSGETTVQTVYFGGGTPTLLPTEALASILDAVGERFAIDEDAEITIEANPETVDPVKLLALRKSGFNRLSLGFQSFENDILILLGRGHSAEEALRAFEAGREAGFDNISIDLISGIPGQSLDSWTNALGKAVELGPEHISTYSLSVDEGTPLARLVDEGRISSPVEDEAAAMYERAIDLLTENGYEHYEISNFAKEGRRSRHNTMYWQDGDYLGIGAGAHSKIGPSRWENLADVDEYIRADDKVTDRIELTDKDRQAESLFLGLRMLEGVDWAKIAVRLDAETLARYRREIDELKHFGLLEETKNRLKLTRRGILLGNEVFCRFV